MSNAEKDNSTPAAVYIFHGMLVEKRAMVKWQPDMSSDDLWFHNSQLIVALKAKFSQKYERISKQTVVTGKSRYRETYGKQMVLRDMDIHQALRLFVEHEL